MKPDEEPVFCHSNLVCKHDSKPFEYNNGAFHLAEPKGTMKENQKGISCLNGHGRDADTLASEINNKDGFWNTPELECLMVVDDFTNGNESEVKDSVTPGTIPTDLFEEDTDLYTDKNVMECELPELIVCYRESTYHVKDICIDEGVPLETKILIGNMKDDQKGICTSLPSNGNMHDDMTNEVVDTEFVIQDGLKSTSQKDCDKDAANEYGTKEEVDISLFIPDGLKSSPEDDIIRDAADECVPDGLKSSSESDIDQDDNYKCGAGDPMQTVKDNCNATDNRTDYASSAEFVCNSMLSVKEFCTPTSLKSLLESSKYGGNDFENQSDQISSVETISKSPAVVSTAEESKKSGHADDLFYNRNMESGTITFNFDSSKLAASTRDESPKNVNEHILKSQNVPTHEDGIPDNLSVDNQIQRGEGESSFSAAVPLSGLISYSGQIAFSGSISLRSDSSTTSTRSFAFPVLQSEWNSSPIRMAKADRKRFRKHRGWRQGLFCCGF